MAQRLQLHGGLRLELDAVAKTEQARDGIEQAPRARRQRRVQTTLDGRRENPPCRPVQPAREVEVELLHGLTVRGAQKDGRHAPGLADRGLAARQRHALEVTDPLEPDEIGHQELAAPHVPSVP